MDEEEVQNQHASESFNKFNWKIENVSKLNEENRFSPIFRIGRHKWRLLAFCRRCNMDDYLSVYVVGIECKNWRFAKFSLAIVDQTNNENISKKDTHDMYRFTEDDDHWGFDDFIRLKELKDPNNGYIKNDACIVEVEFRLNSIQDFKQELVPIELTESVEEVQEISSGMEEPTTSTGTDTSLGSSPVCSDNNLAFICAFCQTSTLTKGSGSMLHIANGKQVMEDEVSGPNVIHVHQKCIERAPQVYYVGKTVMNLELELARASELKCCCCGLKGATLGCFIRSCRNTYHFPCAFDTSGCQWDEEGRLMLCPNHFATNFSDEKTKKRKMSATTRFLGGRKINKKRKTGESSTIDHTFGDVENADVVVQGCDQFPPTPFKLNLEKYSKVEDSEEHASKQIDFASTSTRYMHRGSLSSVINVYKKLKKHSEGVACIIEKAGWGHLLSMEVGESSHAIIDCIVERWWDKTHTFHFSFGELGLTPLDWTELTGLSIGIGSELPHDAYKYNFTYVQEHVFPELKDDSTCRKEGKPVQWTSDALTVAFLKEYFSKEYLSTLGSDVKLVERVARAFFMYAMGQFFFSNAKNYIDSGWLAAFEDLNQVGTYDWGGFGLASLYMSLDNASRKMKSLNGPFQILEFWGYEYLGICRPHVPTSETQNEWPRCSRWKGKKKTLNILVARIQLDRLSVEDVTWQPWNSASTFLGCEAVRKASEISRRRALFKCADYHVWYLGDRCWRQNNPTFAVPVNPPQHMFGIGADECDRLKESAYGDAKLFVNIVSYDEYLQYWQHVTSLQTIVSTVDWEVELYGFSGDVYKRTIHKPAEHVPIPSLAHLSYPQAYSMIQEYADFVSEFRKVALTKTKDWMNKFMMANQEAQTLRARIGELEARNRELEAEAAQLREYVQQASQPSLGYGNFQGRCH